MKNDWRMGAMLLVSLLLAACSAAEENAEPVTQRNPTAAPTATTMPPTVPVDLPDLGLAPELANEVWLNSDGPMTIAGQQGKVVLLEFWTYSCVNCKRTIPFIREWHERYTGDNFTVISVHYPEFDFERDVDKVQAAAQDLDVAYPIAIDNAGRTWRAYNQRFWPTTYLIDKHGRIRYKHIGEFTRGSDKEAEAAIEALLAEK